MIPFENGALDKYLELSKFYKNLGTKLKNKIANTDKTKYSQIQKSPLQKQKAFSYYI